MNFGGFDQQGGGYGYGYGNESQNNYSFGGGGQSSGGGGGFMTGSGGGVDDDSKARGGYKNQTIRPVTIKQLTDIPVQETDAPIMLDNEEIKQVTFVGIVRNITPQPININYSIEDGTGIIDVRVWPSHGAHGDNDMMDDGERKSPTHDPSIEVDKYVRVYGDLKFFNSKRSVSAHKIRPVKDHNEITYHGLEAVYVHLTKTRGPPSKAGGGAMSVPSGANQQQAGGAYSAGAAYGGGGYGAGGFGGGMNMSSLQAAVLEVITQAPQESHGVQISSVQQKLTNRFQSTDITKAVEWLISEGHLYNTIDESYVKSTAQDVFSFKKDGDGISHVASEEELMKSFKTKDIASVVKSILSAGQVKSQVFELEVEAQTTTAMNAASHAANVASEAATSALEGVKGYLSSFW
ncbi:Replication factor A protein 2 [Coemansia sp. RSA 1200]|nr:Replication factor A protein 2 [Coemansia sp. RSA 1200]